MAQYTVLVTQKPVKYILRLQYVGFVKEVEAEMPIPPEVGMYVEDEEGGKTHTLKVLSIILRRGSGKQEAYEPTVLCQLVKTDV